MKKALALVLALVLALSMAVSAFAALVELAPVVPEEDEPAEVVIVDLDEDDEGLNWILYTRPNMPIWNAFYETELTDSYVTYIALDPTKDYKDIVLTANGNLDAEKVDYDPETMCVHGMEITFEVLKKGENVGVNVADEDEEPKYLLGEYTAEKQEDSVLEAYAKAQAADIKAYGETYLPELELGCIPTNDLTYDEVCAVVDFLEDYDEVTTYAWATEQYVNIIKLTVENNFSAHYTEGTLKVEAKLNKKAVENTLTLINDVTIFEYEEVKHAVEKEVALELGTEGYSDFWTAEFGYDKGDNKYDEEFLRQAPAALVVSTTAFRAIAGKDLTVDVYAYDTDGNDKVDASISVTLKEIAAGQKGVNFFAWNDMTFEDKDEDGVKDRNEDFETISFGFKGNQKINGKFEIKVALPIDYYELRELFGEKVEEDDIIEYYVVNQDKEVVKTIKVDYMTFDPTETLEFTIEGENEKLGWYTLTMDVPAVETEGEANPNTGAESVVGVVAALAVVSVATAAAVSLKK